MFCLFSLYYGREKKEKRRKETNESPAKKTSILRQLMRKELEDLTSFSPPQIYPPAPQPTLDDDGIESESDILTKDENGSSVVHSFCFDIFVGNYLLSYIIIPLVKLCIYLSSFWICSRNIYF